MKKFFTTLITLAMILTVTTCEQPINVGGKGPGGGFIFFAEGGQFMECSGELGRTSWDQAIIISQGYRGGGFSDWHLPSRSELDLMYRNLADKNKGKFSDELYWTSEKSSYGAYYQDFENGMQDDASTSSMLNVRAVRSYSDYSDDTPNTGTTLNIKNQSSYDLLEIMYSNYLFWKIRY
ncbi:MAG: DUF1566 domain-containing protein [Treponema sp.]|jgi:hypothetical protein|nr:DUF1566 domain-containing protein [Treponema sp.]